jgi:ferredoxin-type protein NapF
MGITSLLANKCFEYLLNCDAEQEQEPSRIRLQDSKQPAPVKQPHVPPPWSVPSKVFQTLCDGCGKCISACDNRVLISGKSGYPQIDFSRGFCSFCGACAEICPQNAFAYDPAMPPWEIQAHINPRCLIKNKVICRSCEEQCDRQAIQIPRVTDKDQEARVLADSCNGCGACFKACPVGAIEIRYSGAKSKKT